MLGSIFMKMFKRFCLYFLILLIPVTAARAAVPDALAGKAFSDPNQIADVAPGFKSRPVQYDKNVGKVDVVITLGQQTYPALHKIVEDIARQQGITVNIQQGSCGATAKKLLKKSVDIGTYCCPPAKNDRLPGLVFHTIAIGPIALFTNSVNPIENVSFVNARKIFEGDYVHWSDVPSFSDFKDNQLGSEMIQPVVRLHCKKRPGHWRLLLDNQDMFSPRIQSVATIADMVKQVSDHENAIGYETPYLVNMHSESGRVKLLSINGNSPDNLYKLLKGEYPLYRTYSLTTWSGSDKNEKAVRLLAAIRDYVEKNGAQYSLIPASQLRLAGWKFKGDELVGEPDGSWIAKEHNQ
jgi:ABC-type phosphate transport system substrate-binding protein